MFDVLIIGAGVTGLTTALHLKQKGKTVAVFDKGNGVGGRTATRKITVNNKNYAFDYGCSHFRLGDPRAAQWFSDLRKNPQFPRLHSDSEGYYFEDGMRSLSEWMAEKVESDSNDSRLFRKTKITSITFNDRDSGWTISDGNERWTGKQLVITAPAPQAAELLQGVEADGIDSMLSKLKTIRYQPLWTVLTTSEQEIPSDLLARFIHGDPDLISVVDNHRRGVSEHFAYNFQYAKSWSRDYLEASFDQVEYDFIRRWNRKMSAYPLQTLKAHRWRYAFPIVVPNQRNEILSDKSGTLFYGSDALFSPKIEGAILAGLVLSEKL